MSSTSGTNSQALALPKGGGAIKGIGETFQPNLFTGTGDFSVPIATSPGREGFGPQLTLHYSTGNGNGPFGLGWQLAIPCLTRKTEKGLPRYTDEDVFVLSGAEDLVVCHTQPPVDYAPPGYRVTRYRPRTEGLFARIEKWVRQADGDVHWRATTRDNVTSLYGKSASARLADPADPRRVFQWFLEESFDAKGNHILYEYMQEPPGRPAAAVFEQHRTGTQTYLRRILYGNTPDTPDSLPEARRVGPVRVTTSHQEPRDPSQHVTRHYVFEVLFDYGDLPETLPMSFAFPTTESTVPPACPVREDPFSTFRAGFEIRTFRRCQRVLMLHHFNEGEVAGAPLVKATNFAYDVDPQTHLSFLAAVYITGYRQGVDDHYVSAAMPPVEFTYSRFEPDKQYYQSVTAEGNDLPPRALNDPSFTLVDLFGDALPDILRTSETGYDVWRNLGSGHLDQRRPQHGSIPSVSLAQPRVTFGDMGGDGLPDLLVEAPPLAGFFEATPDGQWQPFRRFACFPSFDLADPNLRLVDLTGDGLPDILMTRDQHFLWCRCLGEEGYAEPQAIPRVHDLDEFPDVSFSDPAGRVRLADMSGDGLNDIVLVHDGRIDYWPNLGYGRFGKRITMAATPRIGYGFDPRRLFLVDLDGSGCADLVYVEADRVHFWFNQSGNSWSARQTIHGTPPVTDLTAIQFADFFGTGTASLVWSYDYALQPGGNYKVLDFCGGQKPYLLTQVCNNLGATTRVQYAPSTRFYLEDKANGHPWLTSLPFPVQVVEKVEVIDHVGRTKLVTTYKYHHGYYDGRDREFRGFGRVDQCDTEVFEDFAAPGLHGADVAFDNRDPACHQPPVETRTWFHTGVYFDPDRHLDYRELTSKYRTEYYAGDPQAFVLGEHAFERADGSAGVGPLPHEAYRALRGAVLRTEIYGRDGTAQESHPYLVTEQRYWTREVQPGHDASHGVYFTMAQERLTYHYERHPQDPRIGHQLTLEVDAFGNITSSAAVGYPRRVPVYPEQSQTYLTCTEAEVINKAEEADWYRIGVPYQARVYELTGLLRPASSQPFTVSEVREGMAHAENLAYELLPDSDSLRKRLLDCTRTRYWQGDLSGPLPLGDVAFHALPYESYQMALTPGLVEHVYSGRVDERLLSEEGKYVQGSAVHAAGDLRDNAWWIPSGQQRFSAADFFLPVAFTDPFGHVYHTAYDDYDLLRRETRDPLDNVVSAESNYRVMQPWQVTDPNGNRTRVAFDALGMVVGTAVMGKAGEQVGDSLEGFVPDLSPEEVARHLEDPLAEPQAILSRATTRLLYDLWRYQRRAEPVVVHTLARETHDADLAPGQQTRVQHSVLYSDGFGREAMTKVQAEPGPTPQRDPVTGRVVVVDGTVQMTAENTTPRWVGTGRTVYTNKGKAVKKYEPFFSDTQRYEDEPALVEWGVTPVLHYDPLGRLIRTDNPNGTFSRIDFDPWCQTTWDENDTVLESQWYQERGAPAPEGSAPTGLDEQEQRAAYLAAQHAHTPAIVHLDTLGRTFLALADNKDASLYRTHTLLDIEGQALLITDARDNAVMEYRRVALLPDGTSVRVLGYDLAGRRLYQHSMDAGERLVCPDVTGNPLRTWDSRGHQLRASYDALRRPTHLFVQPAALPEFLAERTVYGERHPDAATLNLRGKVYQQYDGAGVVTNEAYDFKGNLQRSTRHLAREQRRAADWTPLSALTEVTALAEGAAPLLAQETETERMHFTTHTAYDALNRPMSIIAPDDSETLPTYNEANLLNTVRVRLRGAEAATDFVTNMDYNARGQRVAIQYGNDVRTTYQYDDKTFRLLNLRTVRHGNEALQDLTYTYDPVGNITHIRDAVTPVVCYDHKKVLPHNSYLYDPLYRLVSATGREHIGQNARNQPQHRPELKPHYDFNDSTRSGLVHPNDGQAMRAYTQKYTYDPVGNILRLAHIAGEGSWTRHYDYASDSNRLRTTNLPGDGDDSRVAVATLPDRYRHNAHGNMIQMPHLARMEWDCKDRLTEVDLGGGGTAYYIYDAAGQRVRKVHVHNGATVEERIYLGGFEVYRKHNGSGLTLERETLHIMDDKQRIAMVETRTQGDDPSLPQLIRFQLGNHLASASLELDAVAQVISHEEYYPYGSTSYQAVHSQTETPKRYRYTGVERDEETGLNYHTARYYAPWLGRWISCDPKRVSNHKLSSQVGHKKSEASAMVYQNLYIESDETQKSYYQNFQYSASQVERQTTNSLEEHSDDSNLYCYCRNQPLLYIDPSGKDIFQGRSWTTGEPLLFNRPALSVAQSSTESYTHYSRILPIVSPVSHMQSESSQDSLNHRTFELIQSFLEENRNDPWLAWRMSALYRVSGDYYDIASARAEHFLLRYAMASDNLLTQICIQRNFDLPYHAVRNVMCGLSFCEDDPELVEWENSGYELGRLRWELEISGEEGSVVSRGVEYESERQRRAVDFMIETTEMALGILGEQDQPNRLLQFELTMGRMWLESLR